MSRGTTTTIREVTECRGDSSHRHRTTVGVVCIDAAERFLDTVATDPAVAQRLATIAGDLDALAVVVAEPGVDTDPDELDAVWRRRVEDEGLEDSSPEGVAGGHGGLIPPWARPPMAR
jgi:hypothetical protein